MLPPSEDLPTMGQDALAVWGEGLDITAAHRHRAEELPGLSVAAPKTVRGSTRALVLTTDQACWNRWLPEGPWAVQALNEPRRAWLQPAPPTRDSVCGVMAMAKTLGDP